MPSISLRLIYDLTSSHVLIIPLKIIYLSLRSRNDEMAECDNAAVIYLIRPNERETKFHKNSKKRYRNTKTQSWLVDYYEFGQLINKLTTTKLNCLYSAQRQISWTLNCCLSLILINSRQFFLSLRIFFLCCCFVKDWFYLTFCKSIASRKTLLLSSNFFLQ